MSSGIRFEAIEKKPLRPRALLGADGSPAGPTNRPLALRIHRIDVGREQTGWQAMSPTTYAEHFLSGTGRALLSLTREKGRWTVKVAVATWYT